MSKHRQASPECPFVKNRSDNVPLVPGGEVGTSGEEEQQQLLSGQQAADSGFGSQEDEEETDDARHFSARSPGG